MELQDVLNRINQLLEVRHWSIGELGRQANLAENTIYRWFGKRSEPSFSALMKVSNAFNMSLVEFLAFSPEDQAIAERHEAMRLYEKLDDKNKRLVFGILKELTTE